MWMHLDLLISVYAKCASEYEDCENKKITSQNLNLDQELEIHEVISRSYYKCVFSSSNASIYRLLRVREIFHIYSKRKMVSLVLFQFLIVQL